MSNAAQNRQMKFQVSRGDDASLGPWSVDEIAELMAKGELAATDYAYDEAIGDWVALFELSALKERFRAKKPKAKPHSFPVEVRENVREESGTVSHTETDIEIEIEPAAKEEVAEWFVQKGPHQYGPFSYAGVIRGLQEKTVYEFDLVCKVGSTDWVRVAEHAQFKQDAISAYLKDSDEAKAIFMTRQHPRLKYENEVIVHDNRSAWLGKTFEVSRGGSGLVIENATLVPGQTLTLHFAAREDLPAFNAVCEVVSKRYSKAVRDEASPIAYNVRFIKLDNAAESAVMNYLDAKAKQQIVFNRGTR